MSSVKKIQSYLHLKTPISQRCNTQKLGGTIRVIRKPGVGHHPHSLAEPAPLVEFIERAWKAAETKPHRLTP